MTGPNETPDSADRPPDDRIIGRAFWASAAVVGLVAGGVVLWRQWPRAAPQAAAVAPLPLGPAVIAALPAASVVATMTFQDRSIGSNGDWGAGIDRVTGAAGDRLLPETMGGGVAVWDVDADGDLDLLFPDGDAWPNAAAGSRRGQGMAVFLNQHGSAAAAPVRGSASPEAQFVRAQNTGLAQPWPPGSGACASSSLSIPLRAPPRDGVTRLPKQALRRSMDGQPLRASLTLIRMVILTWWSAAMWSGPRRLTCA